MYNILNSIPFVNLYTELATVIRLAVVFFFFFKSGIQMCTTAIINNIVVTNNFIHNFQLRTYLTTQKQ